MSPILGIIASQGKVAANSYESIATFTLGSNTASVTFSSIPQTYKHLQIRYNGRSDRSQNSEYGVVSYNSDTSTNYSFHSITGDGATVPVDAAATVAYQSLLYFPGALRGSNIFGSGVVDILDYANTNKYKTLRTLNGYDSNGDGRISFQSGSWRNTNAITSITIATFNGSNFITSSSFALYGIKG